MSHDTNVWDLFPVNKRHYVILEKLRNNPGMMTREITRNQQDTKVLRLLNSAKMVEKIPDDQTINGIRWFITAYGEETFLEMQNIARRFPGVKT